MNITFMETKMIKNNNFHYRYVKNIINIIKICLAKKSTN